MLKRLRLKLDDEPANAKLKARVASLTSKTKMSTEEVIESEKKDAVEKFAQAGVEVMFYGLFTIIGLAVVPSQPFAWPSAKWWEDFKSGSHMVMGQDLRCYYIAYAARYLQGIVSCLMEHRRKDFIEMQVHHVVTVGLVCVSYIHGYNRIGVIVMVLLDPADVPLHIAKLCKYTADYGGAWGWQVVADRFFEMFAVTFTLTRILIYPYVCWSAAFESRNHFEHGGPEWCCVILCYVLLVLQFYWFTLLIKAIGNMLAKGGIEDIRSDDEGEEAMGGRGKLTCADTPPLLHTLE